VGTLTKRDKLVLQEWGFCVWADKPPKENEVLISKDAQPWAGWGEGRRGQTSLCVMCISCTGSLDSSREQSGTDNLIKEFVICLVFVVC
jgi:hypothetical protein